MVKLLSKVVSNRCAQTGKMDNKGKNQEERQVRDAKQTHNFDEFLHIPGALAFRCPSNGDTRVVEEGTGVWGDSGNRKDDCSEHCDGGNILCYSK